MRALYVTLAAGVVLLAACAGLLLRRGDLTSQIALIAMFVAPPAIFFAITRPLIFPFCLYVVLVPFDNLLAIGTFGTLTKLLAMIAGACVALGLLRYVRAAPFSRASLLLCGVFAWMLLSVSWAIDQQAALNALIPYATIFAFYIVLASATPSRAELVVVLVAIAVSGLIAAGYGANNFIHNPFMAVNAARLVLRNQSTDIDPNQFADSLLAPCALIAMWGLRSRNLLFKAAAFGGISLLGAAIVVSGSREALIALVLLFLYLVVRSKYRVQMLAVMAALAPLLTSMPTTMWMRFTQLASTGGAGRADIWSVGLEAAKHRPLLGYGIGNFQAAYDQFYLGVPQTYPYGFDSPAHNIVLHYGVELGVVGLAFVALWFVLHWRAMAAIDVKSPWRDYAIALEAALVAIGFTSFTIDLLTYKYAWLVFAAIALLANAERAGQESAETRAATLVMMPARSAR
ncbi:MAG TPA: O-antigen ligase family protein [Candidatus Aquilonibacter sp.]|nr:O-antigen ligase family protein [Candidatus Aquilonibacter sp.]